MKAKSRFLIIILALSLLLIPLLVQKEIAAEIIPKWVKDIAKWYGEDKISESDFINAIKFLIDNNIIILDLDNTKLLDDINQEVITATVMIPNGSAEQSNIGFYIPLNLEIEKGTIVEWVNSDGVGHTIQSQDGFGNVIPLFNSNVLQTSEEFSYKFEESGTYNYFCTLHPWRVGVVTVR